MKTTQFRFFKNTPLIDFQNTIHFDSNAERDAFFLEGGHYSELTVNGPNAFNFVRDRSTVTLDVSYNDMQGVNYCTFLSSMEPQTRFYAYVVNYEYLNDHAVRVYLMIDPIMTYTQGAMLQTLPNLSVQRQHLPLSEYQSHLWELKNNDDILKTDTKSYFHGDRMIFDDLLVIISTAASLEADFGTEDNPHIRTASGQRFDKVTSPQNLYAVDFTQFNDLMRELAPYPWIAQNVRSMVLIPKIFMENNLTLIQFASSESLSGVTYLYRITGLQTRKLELETDLSNLSYSLQDLYDLFDLDPIQDQHLLRNEYTTTEVYNYSGSQLFIDNGQLNPARGLDFQADIITGHFTELLIYIEGYRVQGGLYGPRSGSYANDALVFSDFDDVPMLIDNFGLSLAKNANRRELAESKLVTNRAANVMDPNADLKDRFFNAASLISNVSVGGLFGKFSDEYEYYRTQKAEQADMALETPTITQQTNGNSFNIANDLFGVHVKFSKPALSELRKIKKYYKLFGYQVNDQSTRLSNIKSMTICNYVQFSGSWSILNADVALVEMMKAQFENGVRLWHNNGTANPMEQTILNNEMRV